MGISCCSEIDCNHLCKCGCWWVHVGCHHLGFLTPNLPLFTNNQLLATFHFHWCWVDRFTSGSYTHTQCSWEALYNVCTCTYERRLETGHLNAASLINVVQDSSRTGWRWLPPTTTQLASPPLKLHVCTMFHLSQVMLECYSRYVYPSLRLYWVVPSLCHYPYYYWRKNPLGRISSIPASIHKVANCTCTCEDSLQPCSIWTEGMFYLVSLNCSLGLNSPSFIIIELCLGSVCVRVCVCVCVCVFWIWERLNEENRVWE